MQRSQAQTLKVFDSSVIIGCDEVRESFEPRKKRSNILASQYATLADMYCGTEKGNAYLKRAELVRNCTTDLWFYGDIDENGEKVGKDTLLHMYTCKDRLCPQCNKRRSLKAFSNISAAVPLIKKQYELVFVTLTVKNVPLGALSDGISLILSAWRKLMHNNKKVRSVIKGSYRTLEVTFNEKDQTWHPHIHAIWLVDPSTYFTKSANDYISRDELAEMWRFALGGVDYKPFVSLEKAARGKDPINEVTKYVTKESTFFYDLDALDEISSALRGVRLISVSGAFRQIFKALKLDEQCEGDLVHINESKKTELRKLVSHHHWELLQYVCVGQELLSADDFRSFCEDLRMSPVVVERLAGKLFGGGSVADPRMARPPEPAEGR